ncbi:MAG TPA: multiheme c-type cytochrome [Bryobacteraceae bacterium]|nr:multiheme c-type cytochrome [Bryobacteraceae bacterium]
MTVAGTAALNAQTTLAPRLALRAVTNGDVGTYKLPSTTQLSGGLGTVGLGEPLYMEVQVDGTIAAAQLGGVVWAITEAPQASKAALVASPLGSIPIAEPSDRMRYQVAGRQLLIPDVHGLYVVSATVTVNGTSTPIYQSYIAGTYVGVAVCTQCHGGGLAQSMVTSWSTTAHATVFKTVIDGTAIAGYTESASCAACHTVGYDANSTVNDGGFSSVAKQLGWAFPTTGQVGNFESMPQSLQNVSNIQCENCHGPGSEHANFGGDTIAVAIPKNSGACNQCHDEPSHHIKTAAWANSVHAVTTTIPAGNATCVGCHTGTGFIAKMNGASPITDTTYHSIDCYTCHEPHGDTTPSADAHLIRNMATVTLIDGTVVKDAGEGALCMQCHQSRMKASAVDTTAGSAHFGPHEGPQADVLLGTNGYTYGLKIPSSAHHFVTTNACVDCHMQTVASTDPAFMKAGDHTFKTTYTPAGGTAEDLVGACQNCHGTDLTTFDVPTFDFSGNGTISGVQTEVQGLLDQLSMMLPPNSLAKTSLSIDSTWTKPQLEAAYNWLLITNDGSRGIHNMEYTVGLLKASIANLQAQK